MSNLAVPQVDYDAIERERLTEIQRSITERLGQIKDLGQGDTLRFVVLSDVAKGRYDEARAEVARFVDENWKFPNFQSRANRYRNYCLDVINAVEAKRSFPGLGSMPLAKQQEIYESVVDHFEDLKANLKLIERLEKEAKLDDIRSTVMVLKAAVFAVSLIIGTAFALEWYRWLGGSVHAVYDSSANDLAKWMSRILGF